MSVPAFEQSVHLPRFPVLQDLRCGPAAFGCVHASPEKIASIRGLFSRQII
jgi:hypothetical protein